MEETKEQQQQELAQIAKQYQSNQEFKTQVDSAYEAAKQQAPDQIAELESQYKEQSKIVFAYIMMKQAKKKQAASKQKTSNLPGFAKNGSKLNYIGRLNGHCPEGYEIDKYLLGGCVKCRKGKALSIQEQLANLKFQAQPRFSKCGAKIKKAEIDKCGGKAKKHADGSRLTLAHAKSLKYKGGPGDVDSTQGMILNKKQKAMLKG